MCTHIWCRSATILRVEMHLRTIFRHRIVSLMYGYLSKTKQSLTLNLMAIYTLKSHILVYFSHLNYLLVLCCFKSLYFLRLVAASSHWAALARCTTASHVQAQCHMMYSCLHGKRSSTCSTSANQSPTSRHGVIYDLLVGDCWTYRTRGGVNLPGGLSPWLARWCGTRCRTTWETRQSAETLSASI